MTRTSEQIKNLRQVLAIMIGPFAYFMSDDGVDKWADKMQAQINSTKVWEIKVRMKDKKDLAWDNIQKEPKAPYLTLNDISDKCWYLLLKYPLIDFICISDSETHKDVHIFDRNH